MNTLTSELDAVNIILSVIGQAPLSTLAGAGADAQIARNTLVEVSREVQSRGWVCNTEVDVPLAPDADGHIYLPRNCLCVSLRGYNGGTRPVQRGERLYDARNRTDRFAGKLYAHITYLLEFEDLPETLRRFITIRAARTFQDRMSGAESTHVYTEKDEYRACAQALRTEGLARNSSALDNPEIAQWTRRSL